MSALKLPQRPAAGAGATQALADKTGARLLTGDPVTEAQRLLPPPGDKAAHDLDRRG